MMRLFVDLNGAEPFINQIGGWGGPIHALVDCMMINGLVTEEGGLVC